MSAVFELIRRAAVNTSTDNEIYSPGAGAGSYEEASHELYKVSPEVTPVHLAYTLLSVFTVVFGVFSAFIKEKLYAGEAIIALVFGIAFGPYGAGIFTPTNWAGGDQTDDITLEITRIVIALSVFAVGVELPRAYIWKHWRSLSILLGPTMLCGWIISAALIDLMIPGLTFLDSLVVAACVTPTDPILAASVVGKGKFAQDHVPAHIRHVLQAESGSNDGAAFPFLYFALFWLLRGEHSVGQGIGWWFVLVVLYQIVLGCIIGACVGIGARKLMKFAKYRSLIDRESMVAMYVALALFVTGTTTLAGSDDLLAAFACGTAFAWDDWFSESIEDSNFSSILDLIVNCGIFFFVGASIPFAAWNNPDLTLNPWRLAVLSLLILILRRIPVIFALQKFIPDCRTVREAIFIGHFGPMGIGAVFISTLARERLPTPEFPPQSSLDVLALTIVPITYCLVLSSVLVHGLSIPVFTNSRRIHKRVSSFSRTFTNQSTRGDNEPSWLSRVRRLGDKTTDSLDEEKQVYGKDSAESSNSGPLTEKAPVYNEKEETEDPNEKEVWQEGDKIVTEDPSGEHTRVERRSEESERSSDSRKGGMEDFAERARQIEAMITQTEDEYRDRKKSKKKKGKSKQSDTEEDAAGDDEPIQKTSSRLEAVGSRPEKGKTPSGSRSPSPSPAKKTEDEFASKPPQKRGHWWTRDEASGLPRELSLSEKRAVKADRAVRKEKHYCKNESEVRWREGNRIIVERADGELVQVLDLNEEKRRRERQASLEEDDLLADSPNLYRLTSHEHGVMSDVLSLLPGHHSDSAKTEHHSRIHDAFNAIVGPPPSSSKSKAGVTLVDAPSIAVPEAAKRPSAIRFNTAGMKKKLGLKKEEKGRPDKMGISNPSLAPPQPSPVIESDSEEVRQPPTSDSVLQPREIKPSTSSSAEESASSKGSNSADSKAPSAIRFNLPSSGQYKTYELE